MRVLFFHAYPRQYGGAQRLTHALATELVRRGHSVVIVLPHDGQFADRLGEDGLPVSLVETPACLQVYGGRLHGARGFAALRHMPRYWNRLRAEISAWGPDVAHVNDHRGALLAAPAARWARVPVVWHLHGTHGSRAITLLAAALASRIVFVSEAARREQLGLDRFRQKTSVVHNSLVFRPAARTVVRGRQPPSGPGRPLVVTGARLHPDKGIDVLLHASAILRRSFPQLRVVVAGAPQPGYEAYHAELVDLQHRLELERTVEFCGLLSDPLPLWREADVYVQPSRRESFGLGVLEAMSVGTPVVATRVGGLVEVIESDVTGLHVASDSPAELASAIATVVADGTLASRLSASAVVRSRRTFSTERMVARMLDVYAEAAATGGGR
jgi:glycosyltransferase involved in cell wall biosynthesis